MGVCRAMKKAVFFDRDGVINKLVYNPVTCQYESPHREEDLELFTWSVQAFRALQQNGYLLFLISNQPSFAKGKTQLERIQEIHAKFHGILRSEGIIFTEYYYCYHHPQGIVKEYAYDCPCRKPKPYFVLKAIVEHGIDESSSWLIGDRDTDIICGREAGLRTILIKEPHSIEYQGKSRPTCCADTLEDAVEIILNTSSEKRQPPASRTRDSQDPE